MAQPAPSVPYNGPTEGPGFGIPHTVLGATVADRERLANDIVRSVALYDSVLPERDNW